jgi:O-antigen ligase
MNREAQFLLFALVITSWAKAGFASSWNLWFIDGAVLFCILATFLKYPNDRMSLCQNLMPVLCLAVCCSISFLNPSYKVLTPKEWYDLNIDDYFSHEPNLEKTNALRNGFRNIISIQQTDPNLSIALFFDLKNNYYDNFGSSQSPCTRLLSLYESKIKRPNVEFLPSSPTLTKSNIFSCGHFLFQIMFGIVMYFSVRTRKEIRICIYVVAINAGLLALIGIIQKINYVPHDNLKEIFGIWDTPEPRYFYSSFTYKNHWSCFAIVSLFLTIAVLHYQIKHARRKLTHDVKSFVLLGIIVCIIISIPHSGSRSGFLVLIFGFVVLAFNKLLHLMRSKSKIKPTFLVLFSIVVFAVFSFSFSLNRETTKEMKTNTSTQLNELSNNNMPLRLLLWQDLLNQIKSKTTWGHGFDSYRAVNPIFQSYQVRKMRSIGLEHAHQKYTPLVGHGHNDILELISEFGVWMFLILFIYPLIAFTRILRGPSIFPKFGLLSFLAYLCFSFVDFPSRTPACLLLCASTLALCCKYAHLSMSNSVTKI